MREMEGQPLVLPTDTQAKNTETETKKKVTSERLWRCAECFGIEVSSLIKSKKLPLLRIPAELRLAALCLLKYHQV